MSEDEEIENLDPVEPEQEPAREAEADAVPEQPERPSLTAKQIADIRVRARKEVEKEFLAEERRKLLAKEMEAERVRLAMHDNEHLSGRLSEKVSITIDIPEFSNVPWIQLNQPHGPCYCHGQRYTVPRHVAEQLRESMQMMRRHQNEIDGKKRNRQLPSGVFVDAATGAMSGRDQRAIVGREAA